MRDYAIGKNMIDFYVEYIKDCKNKGIDFKPIWEWVQENENED